MGSQRRRQLQISYTGAGGCEYRCAKETGMARETDGKKCPFMINNSIHATCQTSSNASANGHHPQRGEMFLVASWTPTVSTIFPPPLTKGELHTTNKTFYHTCCLDLTEKGLSLSGTLSESALSRLITTISSVKREKSCRLSRRFNFPTHPHTDKGNW